MRIEEQLRELFNLSLQIKRCQFSHSPHCDYVHIFRFSDASNGTGVYDINVEGYYGDWIPKEDEKSLDSAILKVKQVIKKQNS